MLKIVGIGLILVGGSILIGDYWNDLGYFLNKEKGNERKFNFWRNTGRILVATGFICGLMNFLFI